MKQAIHCQTQEEYSEVQKELFAEGKCWAARKDNVVINDGWISYNKEVCINPNGDGYFDAMQYSSKGYYEKEGYTIISAADFLKQDTTMQDITSLETELARAKTEADKASKLVKEMEEKLAAAKKDQEIKVGDWVVALQSSGGYTTGHFYKVKSIIYDGSWINTIVDSKGSDTNGWYGNRFRKATPEEAAKAKLIEDSIIVKVDGKDYTAKFENGYVSFGNGCARLDNRDFRDAKALFNSSHDRISKDPAIIISNRHVGAVQIGRGLFTRDLVNRICDRLIEDPKTYKYHPITI